MEKKRKKEEKREDRRRGAGTRRLEVPAAAKVQTRRWRCPMLR